MAQDPQDPLMTFMQKQAEKKSTSKKNVAEKAAKPLHLKKSSENSENKDENVEEEEMTEEEKLAEAKKESVGKAASYQDTSEMYKRLFIETTTRYVLLISLLVGSIIALIKLMPAIVAFINGLLSRILLGGLQ
jgi:hypothetical protein